MNLRVACLEMFLKGGRGVELGGNGSAKDNKDNNWAVQCVCVWVYRNKY